MISTRYLIILAYRVKGDMLVIGISNLATHNSRKIKKKRLDRYVI